MNIIRDAVLLVERALAKSGGEALPALVWVATEWRTGTYPMDPHELAVYRASVSFLADKAMSDRLAEYRSAA